MRHGHAVGADLHAEAGAPDVVVEFTEQLFAFVHGLVIVEIAEQRDVVIQRIAGGAAEVILIPRILQTAAVEAHAEVFVYGVVAAEIADPG